MFIRTLDKVINVCNKIFIWIASVLMCIIVIACATQVASRYIPGFKVLAVEEIARLAFIWMTFLIIPVLIGRNGNASVTILEGKLSEKAKPYYHIFIQIIILFFSVLLFKFSIDKAIKISNEGTMLLHVNMGFMYTSTVACGLFSVLNGINNILKIIYTKATGKTLEEVKNDEIAEALEMVKENK